MDGKRARGGSVVIISKLKYPSIKVQIFVIVELNA